MKQLIILTLLATVFLFPSCTTPEKAIQKGKYKKAMNIATRKIVKGKEVAQNQTQLQIAAEAITAKTLHHYEVHNTGIEDWKSSQHRLHNSLSFIGDKNIRTQGLVSESYDKLCDAKYETDFKIVNYYYDYGRNLLAESIETGTTSLAREAYWEFVKSEKEGATFFYDDLDRLKTDCIEYGTIFVDAPSELGLPMFASRVTQNSGEVLDCIVTVDYSSPHIGEGHTTQSRTKHSKTIRVGQKAMTDTSGVTTYEDILQEVVAYEIKKTRRFQGRQQLFIDVTSNSSECFLRSRTETFTESDDCIEVSYSGDMRAVGSKNCKTCNGSSVMHGIRNDLKRRLRRELYVD